MGFSMQPYGIQSMLKDGHRHLSGLDEAVLTNIDAFLLSHELLSVPTIIMSKPAGGPKRDPSAGRAR